MPDAKVPTSESLGPRAAGILLHPTSLPGPHGIGDVGAEARLFVDWLVEAKHGLWQILPLVQPGSGNSPYSSMSALSGNPWLIDLDGLVEDGLLAQQEIVPPPEGFDHDHVSFDGMRAFKGPLLDLAADRLVADAKHALYPALQAFIDTAPWATEVAVFGALKARHEGKPWWEWPAPLRDHDEAALAAAKRELAAEIDRRVALFFLFERQWQGLRAYCKERGVRIVGDVPIYVDRDSADVWSSREQFRLDERGLPVAVAGVPPDFFSETGQLWGNPLYDWSRMAEEGHAWWVARIKRVLEQVDLVRIDHFRAFAAYWEVPLGAEDARAGKWVEGPGRAFFDDLEAALGTLPVIAEDLGMIDEPVHQLRDAVGLPGMRILQFAFAGDAHHSYLPHNYVRNTVVYTGTHDNDTTRSWWQTTTPRERDAVRRYLALGVHGDPGVVRALIREAYRSVAHIAVVPLQDVLDLGGDARMNTPGDAFGNWDWRVRVEALNPGVAAGMRELAEVYGRAHELEGGA